MADKAPDWFFIDIQPDQIDRFEAILHKLKVLMTFRKHLCCAGVYLPLQAWMPLIDPPEESAWILRGDRALTWQAEPPKGAKIVAGEWWDADYQGKPVISISQDAFVDFGLSLGDTVSINVLGRNITAEIANVREIEWESFSINFVFILSPGLLDKAPHSW